MMTKKDFILIANALRCLFAQGEAFTIREILSTLCTAFTEINPRFDKERWMKYLMGECGPSGGKIK